MKNGKRYMATAGTITVKDVFGDRTVDKEEFIRQWVDHVRQCISIADSLGDVQYVQEMKRKIEVMASREFDRLYALQMLQGIENEKV